MKKRFAAITASVLALAMAAGCGQKKEAVTVNPEDIKTVEETKLPVTTEDIGIKIWCNNYSSRVLSNYGDMLSWKEIQKRTGVDVEFIHPTGGAAEQFNIMIASRDYPDVIYYSWGDSLSKYIKDSVAVPLNDYLGIMPNIRHLMEKNETVAKQIKLADGTIAAFPQINSLDEYNYWDGYFIRTDWLKAVGKEVPQTIDQWHDVLKAFKETDLNGNGKNDEIPFSTTKGMMPCAFISAFGVVDDFFISPKDGKITFSVLEDGYRKYIETMRQWYKEGLIDNEFLSVDQKMLDEKMFNNTVGSAYIDNNNSMVNYLSNKPSESFDLTPVPMPKVDGGVSYYPRPGVKTVVSTNAGIVTTQCKHPVEAIKLLDYLYSDEGTELLNWGIEGKSFTKDENGEYRYTDEILHNKEGKTPYDAIAKYCNNPGFMKIYQIKAIRALDSTLPENIASRKKESDSYAAAADKTLILPPLAFTPEEYDEYSKIRSELSTYINEMESKYIIGKEPMDSYDKFVSTVKSMGVERAVEIVQKVYDRYNKS